jgi:hypothetical protein
MTVVLWNTTYLGEALDALHAAGRRITTDDAAHVTPAQHNHINLYDSYSFDFETQRRREGRRPLRLPAT